MIIIYVVVSFFIFGCVDIFIIDISFFIEIVWFVSSWNFEKKIYCNVIIS